MTSPESNWSLTSHLLSTHTDKFERATQSPFLRQAASGTLPKSTISEWLANDRLYMQGYIALSGELLRILQLPAKPTPSKDAGSIEVQILDWLVDALVNIRREERFFVDVSERYGLNIDISDSEQGGTVPESNKLEGLKQYEKLFAKLTTPKHDSFLPWLEGIVTFWATEKVYFEAWSWAKRQAGGADADVSKDDDGGAMRKEFIPNWTNDEFIHFVDTLERLLNEGVAESLKENETLKKQVIDRAMVCWQELLNAEENFWPKI